MITLAVVLWVAPFAEDVVPDVAFWLATGGGALLVLGSMFNRI
jgi:hypothetical protein